MFSVPSGDWAAGQRFGREARTRGLDGIRYPSVRYPEGLAAAIFWPDCLTLPITQNQQLRYRWDGSRVTVRGTLQPMDAETEAQFRAYLREAGFGDNEIGPDDTCTFRPLVLTDGKINGHRTALLIFASAAALLALFGAVGMTLATRKK